MLQGEGIADFPKDVLFEVSAIKRRKGEHGEYGELTYVTTLAGDKRKAGKVRVPESALSSLQTDGPCLMFYAGPKTTSKGRTCHDISIMRNANEATAAELKMMADRLRSMGSVGIKAADVWCASGQLSDQHDVSVHKSASSIHGKGQERPVVRRLRNDYRRTNCHGQAYASRTSRQKMPRTWEQDFFYIEVQSSRRRAERITM